MSKTPLFDSRIFLLRKESAQKKSGSTRKDRTAFSISNFFTFYSFRTALSLPQNQKAKNEKNENVKKEIPKIIKVKIIYLCVSVNKNIKFYFFLDTIISFL